MKKIILILFVTLVISACSFSRGVSEEVSDTSLSKTVKPVSTEEKVDKESFQKETSIKELTSEEIASVLKKNLPKWVFYLEGRSTGFNILNFVKSEIKDINVDMELEQTYLDELQEKYFPKSPDKTKIVDPYSGRILLSEENGSLEVKEEFGEPDSQVGLIDLKSNTYKRILNCGTPCGFDDAFWIDDSRFIVVGYSEDFRIADNCTVGNNCLYTPVIYFFDLSSDTYMTYLYSTGLDFGRSDYMPEF